MNDQFMLVDLARTLEAFLVFSLVALAPGYVLAWLLNPMLFRQRALLTRLAIAVPLSIGVCPIVSYLLGRFIPPAVWVFYGVFAVAFLGLLFRERHESLSRPAIRTIFNRDLIFVGIVAGWAVLGALSLIDLQIGHRLYFPTVVHDYSLRAAVTSSITRGGVPALNPFFFAGRSFVMHYHYFWFILCSDVERISASTVSSRQALIAGTIWSGIGLLALVALYVRFFESPGEADVRRRTLFAIALLSITGLDIIPVVLTELFTKWFYPDLEWWNEQVSAWVTTVLWTPHQLAGLVACLMGFLLLWDTGQRPAARNWIATSLTAGVMFSSAAGMSVHVTLVVALFLCVWMSSEFLRNHRRQAAGICFAGVIAGVLSIPFLVELLTPDASASGGRVPLHFAVRSFRYFDLALDLAASGWKTNLANLMVLPLNYFMELGFFLIVGVVQCRRMWHNRGRLTESQLCGFTMAATSMVVVTFVNSSVAAGNDLGWRGFLPAQFILLLWGADLLADGFLSRSPSTVKAGQSEVRDNQNRAFIIATLVLGMAGSCYELFKIRFYPLLLDTTSIPLNRSFSPDRKLGERIFAFRQIYDGLKRRTPVGAILQHNPGALEADHIYGFYSGRQIAAETLNCIVIFGGDANLCQSRIGIITDVFDNPKAFDATQIDEVCGRLSINDLIVKDTDMVWQDRKSWVWKRTPMLENNYAKIFACGPVAASWKR
jgi:hypothetical protein